MLSFLVGKAAGGVNVNIFQIERAEGEVVAALALFAALLIWLSCLSVHVKSLQCFSCMCDFVYFLD